MDIAQHRDRIAQSDYPALEAESAARRVAWFKQRYGAAQPGLPATPRRAYELFLLEYLGLRPEQVPVVSETATEIEWLSLNPCPTLEACGQLGLDTRLVCRTVYERPVQALLSQLDPQLRFQRSYTEIRPHAPHCRERIVQLDFSALLGQAIEEARAEGNEGHGAVVVLAGQVIARAHGSAAAARDPGLHAAASAIHQAARVLGDGNLCGALLFATCEPCPLCSSLAARANLTTIVYGASRMEAARTSASATEPAGRSTIWPEVIRCVKREA
jgi:tRNA(Arg) A34 adenosine deaminase TadA